MALACADPTDGRTRWSACQLSEASGISVSSVHKILNSGTLKPHKVHHWRGQSPDPEFAAFTRAFRPPKRMTAPNKRHGTICLSAAPAVHEGGVEGRCLGVQSERPQAQRNFGLGSKNVAASIRISLRPTLPGGTKSKSGSTSFPARSSKAGSGAPNNLSPPKSCAISISYNENSVHPFKWTYKGIPLAS